MKGTFVSSWILESLEQSWFPSLSKFLCAVVYIRLNIEFLLEDVTSLPTIISYCKNGCFSNSSLLASVNPKLFRS